MKTRRKIGLLDLLFGIATLLLGLYLLFNPVSAMRVVVIAIGVVALVGGVANILSGYQAPQGFRFGRGVSIMASGFNIIVALLILFHTGAGAYLLSVLLPVWFIAHCVSRLANMEALRVYGRKSLYWSALILNIAGIVFAGILLLNPVASVLSIEFLIGAYLLLIGIGSIMTAFSGLDAKKPN